MNTKMERRVGVALDVAAGLVPAGSSVLKAIRAGLEEYNERRAEEIFRLIATHLGSGDFEAGREQIFHALEHDWARDAVLRGYRDMMAATDPAARDCIAALVAEYLYREKSPDRIYRRIGALLSECTLQDLDNLRLVRELVRELGSLETLSGVRVTVSVQKHAHRSPTVQAGSEGRPLLSQEHESPAQFEGTVALLVARGLAELHQGFAGTNPPGNPVMHLEGSEHFNAMIVLHRCVSAGTPPKQSA